MPAYLIRTTVPVIGTAVIAVARTINTTTAVNVSASIASSQQLGTSVSTTVLGRAPSWRGREMVIAMMATMFVNNPCVGDMWIKKETQSFLQLV